MTKQEVKEFLTKVILELLDYQIAIRNAVDYDNNDAPYTTFTIGAKTDLIQINASGIIETSKLKESK